MNKFNLTFSGEILAGANLEQVKLRFGDLFGIDDPVRLARFFSGETITLRRNLERKDAAQLYHQLQQLGAVATLVKLTASDIAEQLRLAEEETARQAAEQARLAAAEAARKTAETAQRKRVEEEEIARKKALQAATKQRKAAEAAAKRKVKRIQEKAEKARKKVQETARRQAELEEKKRLAAEEDALRKAELEEEKRLAAEEEAHRKAELEKQKRLVAEKEAGRLAAAHAAQIKDAAQRLQQEAQPTAAERHSAEPFLTTDRGQQGSRKSAKVRVRTLLDVPLRRRGETPEVGTPGQRKRQSGAPNLYKLRPFRNSEAVRIRAKHARQRMRQAYAVGVLALATLLIAGGSFLQNAVNPVMTGASAVAINSNSQPLLLAGNTLLVHDRAGVATTDIALSSLGVTELQPPLAFDSSDALIALGRLIDTSTSSAPDTAMQVLRCDLTRSNCTPFSPHLQGNSINAFVINPLDGSLLLADSTAGQLLKVDREGEIVTRAAVALPDAPVLRLHGGLLLMNSAEGPAISVFRYEDNAFAQQLDEILLLPPAAQQLEQSRVGDFVWSGKAWWVDLRDPTSGAGELHRFDENWNYLNTEQLAAGNGPLQLIRWGTKTLVNDPRHPTIQRYNAEGVVEAPFVSTQLQDLIGGQQQHARLADIVWHGGLLLCALAAVLGFGFGYLYGLRGLVYRPQREQGAEPLEDHAAALHWIEPVQSRQLQLRRTGIFYGCGVVGALLLAIAVSVSVWQLAALLLALSGPVIALLLLSRQPVGHIGILGDQLLLVDHSGQYHLGGGPRLHYRGPFLLIDDIVVYCGSRLLPAFSPAPLQKHISPPALGAIKVDYRTIAIKLLECRHPLALGAVAIVAAVAVAVLLLFLQRLF